jgi:hypothetical protein
MTPKEKAKRLVENYCHKISLFSSLEIHYIELAKQCALIAVDEVIKSIPCIPSPIPCEDINDCTIQAREFWQEVKKEIEKL